MKVREKVTKLSVHYRDSKGQRKCGNCAMYHKDGSCDLVLGRIDKQDVCDRWAKRG